MDDLLQDLNKLEKEINHLTHMVQIMKGNAKAFGYQQEKKIDRYFKLETTPNDFEAFLEEMHPIFKKFNINLIQKEDIKD